MTPDFETKLLLDSAPNLLLWPHEWQKLQTHIRERQEMVRQGVDRCPEWFQEELNRLDSRLRAWWDSWREQWVIDRLQDEGVVERLVRAARDEGDVNTAESMAKSASGLLERGPYYLTILRFQPTPTLQLDRELLEMLKAADMQRFESPSAYVADKRAKAEAQQKANEAHATDRVLAAVDGLSSKQLENFIAVEEAIAAGDTITAHGSDERFLRHAHAETQRALARGEPLLDEPAAALNPGMDPRIYKRHKRKPQ